MVILLHQLFLVITSREAISQQLLNRYLDTAVVGGFFFQIKKTHFFPYKDYILRSKFTNKTEV